MSNILATYNRLPVAFTKGEGVWLWDDQGKQYLDALSGIAVCGLGHCHPAVTKAIQEQAATLVHTSNVYQIPLQEELATTLHKLSGMESAFFCNSGAEANEAAIKIARLYGRKKQVGTPTILVTEGAFHGRTMATLSATGNPKVQEGFAPLVSGFHRIPYNDLEAAKLALQENPDIVAILVEPVQGEGGVNVPAKGYLKGLRELADTHDVLLMLDEIQTGVARTGQMFAFQHEGILPDVLSLAKGLGNGFPVGACLVAGKAESLLTAGTHGSTFGGTPLACATALATLNTMVELSLAEQAQDKGEKILSGMQQRLGNNPHVRDYRCHGLMVAIELDTPCPELVALALEQGLCINVTAGSVIRLLPPLVISEEEIETLCDKLTAAINAFFASN